MCCACELVSIALGLLRLPVLHPCFVLDEAHRNQHALFHDPHRHVSAAQAIADGDNCSAEIDVDTDTGATACADCVKKWKKCGGKGIPKVLACCDEGFSCYKRNEKYMQCRRDGGRINPKWDGSVVPCEA